MSTPDSMNPHLTLPRVGRILEVGEEFLNLQGKDLENYRVFRRVQPGLTTDFLDDVAQESLEKAYKFAAEIRWPLNFGFFSKRRVYVALLTFLGWFCACARQALVQEIHQFTLDFFTRLDGRLNPETSALKESEDAQFTEEEMVMAIEKALLERYPQQGEIFRQIRLDESMGQRACVQLVARSNVFKRQLLALAAILQIAVTAELQAEEATNKDIQSMMREISKGSGEATMCKNVQVARLEYKKIQLKSLTEEEYQQALRDVQSKYEKSKAFMCGSTDSTGSALSGLTSPVGSPPNS